MKHYMPKDKSKEDSVIVMKYLAMRRTAQIFDTGRRLIVDATMTDQGVLQPPVRPRACRWQGSGKE